MSYTNKMPIDWHLRCLTNMKASHARLNEDLIRMQTRHQSDKERIEWYEKQIDKAKEQGKDGFDADKFMVSKTQK